MNAAHKAAKTLTESRGDLKVASLTASARGGAENPGHNVRQEARLNRALRDVAPDTARARVEGAW